MISSWILKVTCLLVLPAVMLGVFVAYQLSPSAVDVQISMDADSEEARFWMEKIQVVGGVEAYRLFNEKYAEKNINMTHELAHSFGEALYKVEGVGGVSVCDSNHGFGCYHSFFGWALLDNGIGIIAALDQACIDVYGEKGLGCQHGIGHGILAELGADKLHGALDACATLNWQGPVGGCTSGVFMEYNLSTMGTANIREYNSEVIHYPCTEVAERYKQACYFEQPAWWLQVVNQDYHAVGELCAEQSDEMLREMCYRGVGNVAVGASAYDIDFVIASCSKMPRPEGVSHCMQGAAWIISAQKELGDIWEPLCESLSEPYKDRCFKNESFI